MRITLCLLLVLLLQHGGRAESPGKETGTKSGGKKITPVKLNATQPTTPALAPGPAPHPPQKTPPEWLLPECLKEKYTHLSCSKVFCPPWRRCISGKCVCKLPYQCPRQPKAVCGLDKKPYFSYCQAQASACRNNKPVFSHYGLNCNEVFEVSLKQSGGYELVQVKSEKGRALVCAAKSWNIAAANVICRHQKEDTRGAFAPKKMKIKDLATDLRLPQCMSVKCTGSELSLAECTIYEPQKVEDNTEVAAVNCYNKPLGQDECQEFTCVNQKCIQWKHICDGMDHCGDNSDEMCCKSCQKGFYCKPGVCIPSHAVHDGIRDCLGGEDEVPGARPIKATTEFYVESHVKPAKGSPTEVKPDKGSPAKVKPDKVCPAEVKPGKEPERGLPVDEEAVTDADSQVKAETGGPAEAGEDSTAEVRPDKGSTAEVKLDKDLDSEDPYEKKDVWSSPNNDIKQARNDIENQLECGIPNMDYVYRTEEDSQHSRRKRVVGGEQTLPTQIQWQVAVQEEGSINCGGVYLGGCWVLTAAHCVRQKPQNFHIKFSLWKKHSKQTTSDMIPVKNIIIHKDYNSRTYQNDIALIQLEELANEKECLYPNPAVRSVCVPWSTLQFQPGDTCTISGWGRNKAGRSADALKWANVTIIGDCKKYYKERFFEGMECAGDLDGRVDTCQGDSGGPLVCKDASGLSYVWGIVSWGEKCGEADYPGVYTKVAQYFEWIRFHTGWSAVTKYNH